MNIGMLASTAAMLHMIVLCEGRQITFKNNTEWTIQIFERGFNIVPGEIPVNIAEFGRIEILPHASAIFSTFDDAKHEYTDQFITISPLQQYRVNDLHIWGAAYKNSYVLSRDFSDRLMISQPIDPVILATLLSNDIELRMRFFEP